MNKKTIVVGITGGIAAYKTIEVVSRLRKLGYDVHVILSKNASYFVTKLTLETISNNPVTMDMFNRDTPWEVEHISLAQKADLFLIAPATANVIGKIANGLADDMLTTTFMAATCKKLIAPAMNTNMYNNPVTQENINKLHELGYEFIGPDAGVLACGDIGAGRMSEPEVIADKCHALLSRKQDLLGKKIVVTAGPTMEKIDPVRFITNHSTGKMGYAIAKVARERGADVILVSGKTNLSCPDGVQRVDVTTTQDMLEAVTKEYDDAFAVIKAAAPSDYRVENYSNKKIKKNSETLDLVLVSNPDIAKRLAKQRRIKS